MTHESPTSDQGSGAVQAAFCVKCGAKLTAAERFCRNCGTARHNVPATTPAAPAAAPVAAPAAPAAPAVRYAGFWRRFVAAVIDGLIVAPLWILLSGLYEFASAMALERMVFSPDGVGLVRTINVLSAGRWLLFALVVFGYFVLAEASSRGASLGKRLMRLRVARHDHGRTGIGRSMARTAFKVISAAPMMIGFLLAGWNGQKRALHDFMSGCVVVRVSNSTSTWRFP